MATVWAIGEVADGVPSKLTLELATLARQLAEKSGGESRTVLVGEGAAAAALEAAPYSGGVLAVETETSGDSAGADRPVAALVAPRVAALVAERQPDVLLCGASADGKDVAGLLVGLTDMPVLVNASTVDWSDTGPVVEMSVFGGRLVTRSGFVDGRGIIVVRAGAATAERAATPGEVETLALAAVGAPEPAAAGAPAVRELPAVRVVERVEESSAGAPIEEARIIVGAGRGIGNAAGVAMIEELAAALGGAVGATRAVVDSGWIGYGQQIGQTGKIVKPALYLACGISGAIQHKVGVQTAGTIVAINRDPDAPINEFADLFVVGDLFEILPPLTEAIRARQGHHPVG